jgi:hypothetical protein
VTAILSPDRCLEQDRRADKMTRLFLARDEERLLWVMALIDADVWTYVANTGKFHRNEALRDDYLAGTVLSYEEVGVTEARRAVESLQHPVGQSRLAVVYVGEVGLLDEEPRAVPPGLASRPASVGSRRRLRLPHRRPRLNRCGVLVDAPGNSMSPHGRFRPDRGSPC